MGTQLLFPLTDYPLKRLPHLREKSFFPPGSPHPKNRYLWKRSCNIETSTRSDRQRMDRLDHSEAASPEDPTPWCPYFIKNKKKIASQALPTPALTKGFTVINYDCIAIFQTQAC
jgi:hypothetical protein